MTKHHLLEIYDAENYTGPNPVHVTGICVVKGPEHAKYYILKPNEPISINENTIAQIAVRPHYEGDSINNAVDSISTVGIATLDSEKDYDTEHTYGFSDFHFWKVGKISPMNGD